MGLPLNSRDLLWKIQTLRKHHIYGNKKKYSNHGLGQFGDDLDDTVICYYTGDQDPRGPLTPFHLLF